MDVCPRFSVLCCPMCRYRPCVGLIPVQGPTKCPNRLISSEVKILNRNRT
jgi:hypothetical protein